MLGDCMHLTMTREFEAVQLPEAKAKFCAAMARRGHKVWTAVGAELETISLEQRAPEAGICRP